MNEPRKRLSNPNTAPPRPSTFIGELWKTILSTLGVAITFCVVTLGCACIYAFGSHYGWGIEPTFTTCPTAAISQPPPDFWTCLYFSVVTIATLGYGDYRPVSYGRLVADVEVLAGLLLIGVLISRLVSRRQDRFTKRLVRGQLNLEVQDFRDQLSVLLHDFQENFPELKLENPNTLLSRGSGLTRSIARYWRYEVLEPALHEVVPIRAAGRLMGALIELLQQVAKCVANKKRDDLNIEDINYLRNITDSILAVAIAFREHLRDDGMAHSLEQASETVIRLQVKFKLHRV